MHSPSRLSISSVLRAYRNHRSRFQRSKRRARALLAESLEDRRMMAVDWRNPVNSLDVSDDGFVTPLDALHVINELNIAGGHALPTQRPSNFAYWDASGDQFITPLDALFIINALNANQIAPYELDEGQQIATERSVTITVGQTTGTRTYRLQVTPRFDRSDTQTSSRDLFAIYLVDPQQPSPTLLDRGTPGTTLFTLSETGAELVPGRVHWDGQVVEIDLSELANRDTAELRLQLLSGDGDRGSRVTVKPLSNTVDPEGVAGPLMKTAAAVVTAGANLNVAGLSAANDVEVQVSNVRFNSTTGRYVAELQLHNRGDSLGRTLAVAFPGLPSGVALLNGSGTTAGNVPFVNFSPAIGRGGLSRNARSEPLLVEFTDPTRIPFALSPQILANLNRPPKLAAIGPLTVTPGAKLVAQLSATDADDDPLTFALGATGSASAGQFNVPTGILRSNGELEFRPEPDQLGTYTFDVIATDGALEATRAVTLNVVADPITTTRVSGQVLQVNGQPLAGMRVEIGSVQGLTMPDGKFTLVLGSGPPVSDTLKVRGELFADPLVYPFIAEKIKFLLEHEVFVGVNNMIGRPIFLPSLDVANGEDIDPLQNETVTTPVIPGVSLFVARGTLMNQQGSPFDDVLHITEVPSDLTPAALPENLLSDLVVTIQPGEMVFSVPAPLTFPNRAGWPAGTLMDLLSINPITGEFDDVGDMRVNGDGTKIETISGGVRNSSWHTPRPMPPTPTSATTNPTNQMKGCNHALL